MQHSRGNGNGGANSGGRAHYLEAVRLVLINSLVFYHNLRIFQGPKNHNQIVIKPPVEWLRDSVKMESVELMWQYLGQIQRSLLQEGLNLFFILAGCAAFFSLLSRRNILAFIGERFNKLLLAFLFGVFCLAMPSNYFIASIKAIQKNQDMDSFWTYASMGRAYEPGHLGFLPYLFIITVAMIPSFLFTIRTSRAQPREGEGEKEAPKDKIDLEEGGGKDLLPFSSGRSQRRGLAAGYLDVGSKSFLLACYYALHALLYILVAVKSELPSMWLLVGIVSAMAVWVLKQPSKFEPKLSDVSKTLLSVAFLFPFYVTYLNSQGDPFLIHPFGLSLFLLTFLVVPLLPIWIHLGRGYYLHSPLMAFSLVIFSQLFCLTYPEKLLRSGSVMANISLLPGLEFTVSERTLYSWGFMVIGHTAMFSSGFLRMCYDSDLPGFPLGTLFNTFLSLFFVLFVGPLMTNSNPEGWEFLNPGYVAYDYPRFSRLTYAMGGWFWSWLCIIGCRIGTNEFPRRPWLQWISDCAFGVFFSHVFWEALICYWLVQKDDWDWFFKFAFLNVTVFIGSYVWCWIVLKIPFIRLLAGMKPPASETAGGAQPLEARIVKKVKTLFK